MNKESALLQTGVYCIRNKINQKVYVGSTSRYGFEKRWYFHKYDLRNGCHCNRYLQSSWDKYGEDAFEFNILERCSPECCIDREQWRLDKFCSYDNTFGYNIRKIADSNYGVKLGPLSPRLKKIRSENSKNRWADEEFRRKTTEAIREVVQSEEYRNNHRKVMQRVCNSEEHKEALVIRSRKMWENRTPEQRAAIGVTMSEATKNRYKDPKEREKTSKAIREQWAKRKKEEVICVVCGQSFLSYFPTRATTCSDKCSNWKYRNKKV